MSGHALGRPPARRRMSTRTQWVISVAMALATVGFVGAAQFNSSVERTAFTTSAQEVLAIQIGQLEAEQQALQDQLAAVNAQIETFQASAPGSEADLAALNARLATARAAAGLTPLRGPGVQIEIADSLRQVPPGESAANYLVLAEDLRAIVVALWASGAEAIAINGERLVSTTSIRAVGNPVLVNDSYLQPPFVIQAIGPPEGLAAFESHPSFLSTVQRRIDAFGLEYAWATMDQLDLPAFVGTPTFREGVPVRPEGGG
ncbi:MAG TPA: DUF881 domain-containing protein [Candidatus Limnocylindria bacterium]|nr:DUF881 domain-containing protein [Candidatus Limnocylindria bacterium]